ncbi:hypothetical protein BSL78_23212 [Apostichopus japonicus]|uniref:tRNA-uridine aminocarboxypropyltransferase 1 n=1 Tax=Stichopus japonicus TaxID=307972 RepID=A0A2G8JW96_STIJA|nr:hypothetical protein BSL78_23212 [Apostichopus japonicus]
MVRVPQSMLRVSTEASPTYTYPCIPEYKDPSKVLLVYPSESAKTITEILDQEERAKTGLDSDSEEATPPACKKTKKDPKQTAIPFERIIFIDSTWSQSKKIFNDERLRDLPCVILAEQKTFFWRSQDKEDNYLATIEAIYYFLVELFNLTSDLQYAGQYDNLMYFFVYMYRMVQKQKKNYIKIHKKKKQKKTATHEAGVS